MSLKRKQINSETDIAIDNGNLVIQQKTKQADSLDVIVISARDAIAIQEFIQTNVEIKDSKAVRH